MPNQPVTNTVQIDLRFVLAGNNAGNVMHAGYSGDIGLSDLDALNDVIQEWLDSDWKPLSNELWGAETVTLTDLDSLTGARKAYPISPVIVGDLVGGTPPASVTVAVKADVGHRGRGVAGRVFWIGLDEDQITANTLDSATAILIIAALDNLNAAIGAVTPFSGLVIPHRTVNGVKPSPATSEPVVGFLLTDLGIDVQKDRLPFHKKKKRLPVA